MYSSTETIIRIFWVNEAEELQQIFFVVLLYGNELSDKMKMLCCGNVLQNTHTNNQTKQRNKHRYGVFFKKKTTVLQGCQCTVFSVRSQPGRCSLFFRAPGSSCFSPTRTQLQRTSDSVAQHHVRLEHGNGLLKCSDPLSLRFQKKTLQHTPLLISPLRAFHHF